MTVPTPTVGQVIDAGAWGAVVAADVNGLLTDVDTLETQMAPLHGSLVGVRGETFPAISGWGLTAGAWSNVIGLDVPAVTYPRLAIVSASMLLSKSAGTDDYYLLGMYSVTGFAGSVHQTQAAFFTNGHVQSVYTLPANTLGQLMLRVSAATGTATATSHGSSTAGYNYFQIALMGVRTLGADL